MTYHIEARDVNDAYAEAIRTVMREGADVPSRVSATRELHPAVIDITDTSQRLVTAFGRPVNVAFALAEVMWILGGQRDVETLAFYNKQISNYSDDGKQFNAAYGHRLRHAHGHDQIQDAIDTLRKDPESRQVVLNINHPASDRGWRPERNYSEIAGGLVPGYHNVKHETKDRACNVMALLKIREGKLDWMQIVRSNDAMWGTPYNWMQFLHLQAWMAAAIGVETGKYTHVVDSLHIYDYHFDQALRIRPFDLYRHERTDSRPYEHIAFTAADTTEECMAAVLASERAIRAGAEPLSYYDVPGSGYWRYALEILQAHWYYKKGMDRKALTTLLDSDAVYGLAQARFYYYWRWHKPEHHDMMQWLSEGLGHSGIADWITDSHDEPARVESS